MTFPQYSELDNFTTVDEIDKEIFISQKFLFDLRMKKATNQALKPNFFIHTKRRIAQLTFKKAFLLKK